MEELAMFDTTEFRFELVLGWFHLVLLDIVINLELVFLCFSLSLLPLVGATVAPASSWSWSWCRNVRCLS